MGSNATGILAYGYDLGECPTFVAFGEYDVPDWWDDDSNDFCDAATRRLLDASGFTERYEDDRGGYFPRERQAKEALGVQVVRNSCDAAPTWLLTAKVIKGDWAGATVVALPDLANGLAAWDERLAWAVEALGIAPSPDRPQWLLSADYG